MDRNIFVYEGDQETDRLVKQGDVKKEKLPGQQKTNPLT